MISFLNKGLILASPNHIWAGLSTVQELAKLSDIPEIPAIPNVIDSLLSTSTTDALSANQGRILKESIDSSENSGLHVVSAGTSANVTLSDRQLFFEIGTNCGYSVIMPSSYTYEVTSTSSGFYNRGTISMASGTHYRLALFYITTTFKGLSFYRSKWRYQSDHY